MAAMLLANVTAPAAVNVPLNVSVFVYPVQLMLVQAEAVSMTQSGDPESRITASPFTACVVLFGPELAVVLQLESDDQLEFEPPFMKYFVGIQTLSKSLPPHRTPIADKIGEAEETGKSSLRLQLRHDLRDSRIDGIVDASAEKFVVGEGNEADEDYDGEGDEDDEGQRAPG